MTSDVSADAPENLAVISPYYKISGITNSYLKVTPSNWEEFVGRTFLPGAFPGKGIPHEKNLVKSALDKTLVSKTSLVMNIIRYNLLIPGEEGTSYKNASNCCA